jgi:hypothetical protein
MADTIPCIYWDASETALVSTLPSGDLQRMHCYDGHGRRATPANVSGRLREFAADGVLEVQIRNTHEHYRVAQKIPTLF